MIRVLLVDDHAFVRSSLKTLLEAENDIHVVGECADGADVSRVAATVDVDVVLMDNRMPRVSGIDATRQLVAAHQQAKVLLMTSGIGGDDLARAADAGAVGMLLKGDDLTVLLGAVRTVAEGGTAWTSL